ncbi:hypothetical protein [Pseudomonas sp. PONIH3]|uniref:hypothetical protein n=1 Tax=Pseudomonas sp. PONIH3 TaxID=1636610 RepID=UPI003D2DAD5A
MQTRKGYERVEEARLSRYLTHIKQMVDLFDDRVPFDYSEHLQALREACHDIGLEHGTGGPVCLNENGMGYLDHHRSMNVLVARIRQLTREQWYLCRTHDRRRQVRKQEIQVCDYGDALCELYSRVTIVGVDSHYVLRRRPGYVPSTCSMTRMF